jgi:beta-galactosidase
VQAGIRGDHVVLLNHTTEPTTVPVAAPAPDLLTDPSVPLSEVRLAPRGVAVLRR